MAANLPADASLAPASSVPSEAASALVGEPEVLEQDSGTSSKRPCADVAVEASPAKKPRKAPGSGQKTAAKGRKKALPEEPVEPKPPADALTLFAKSKWSVLVGENKDRLEQAKLMWKALEPNCRSAFQSQAAELKAKYDEASEQYKEDFEAYKKALPPAARAELKKKEKEAAQLEKVRAKEQKERDKEYRAEVKTMGDRLKANLQICRFGPKRGGIWAVPDGQLRFHNIGYDFFLFTFGFFKGKFVPAGASKSSPSITVQLCGSEPGSVFGVTKLRGGSMYAKFQVCAISVTYRPGEQTLDLNYKTEEYF